MRARVIYVSFALIQFFQLIFYFHKQIHLTELSVEAFEDINKVNKQIRLVNEAFKQTTDELSRVDEDLDQNFNSIKSLTELSRKNFIRIKGVHEKSNENLEEKIVELANYIDVTLTTNDIERVNRVGLVKKNQPRSIVAQLANYKLKLQLIRGAANPYKNLEFRISDDVINAVVPTSLKKPKQEENKNECGTISHIDKPVVRAKNAQIYGSWLKDPANTSSEYIWVFPHFYDNDVVLEFHSLRDLSRNRHKREYKLPYKWAGTGHVVLNGSVYYNKYGSNVIVKYSFDTKLIQAERNISDAAFGNLAPYQWSGTTDIDLAVDELGLWVIYATHDNAYDIVISRLEPDTLEIIATWSTNWRKQWAGNAFMVCGVMYVLKKYDEKETSLGYSYNTFTKQYKHLEISFMNKFEWNTMLAYNHADQLLYAWDNGYLVNYNVTITNKQL